MIDNNTNNLSEIQAQWAIVRGKIRQKIGDAQFKKLDSKSFHLKILWTGKVILSVPSNFIRSRSIETVFGYNQELLACAKLKN